MHWQLYVSALNRIPDEISLGFQNRIPGHRVQNLQNDTRSRKFVRVMENPNYQDLSYGDTSEFQR